LVAGLLAACAGAAPQPAEQPADTAGAEAEQPAAEAAEESTEAVAEEAAAPSKYQEAPMLADMVEAGELPPVEERLPAEPMVVQPADRIGKYGGTWRTALVGGQDTAWLRRTISYDYLMRWDPQWTQSVPNIAKSVDVNEAGNEFTFHLREGMKWSDGHPFTADDIVFWWEDVVTHPDLNPAGPPQYMKVGGEPGTVEKIDDYTVVFKFPVPNGLLLQHLSTPDGWLPTRYPKHYLEQFHVKYNEDGLEALVAEAGATDWVNLFQLKGHGVPGAPVEAVFQNADLPTLWAWKFTTAYGEGTQVVAERNPYYWKVDTEGNQLPYIDKVVFDILEDREVLLLKVLNGEIDMMSRHFNTNDNKAVIADNREAGGYQFFDTTSGGNTIGFHINLTHQDPRLRAIFQDKNFRIALSHALNRQEIIDVLLIGQGEPMQNAMCKEFEELYDEEMYTMYTEYDPELAVEYLAKAGITEKGSDGFYLGPDGEPLTFVIQTTESFGHSDMAEMAVQQWRDFGINAELRVMDRSLLYARKDANEHDVHVWGAGGCSEVFLDPRHFFPFSQESTFAQAWVTWYNNPSGAGADTQPEEPPDIVKQQMELYDQIKATADRDQQIELMKEIIAIAKDQFYVIGISSSPPGYGIVRNNFFNVPGSMPDSWQYPTPAPTSPEQYFFE
jgi:peptide/nickel transport system substrate-binding protein